MQINSGIIKFLFLYFQSNQNEKLNKSQWRTYFLKNICLVVYSWIRCGGLHRTKSVASLVNVWCWSFSANWRNILPLNWDASGCNNLDLVRGKLPSQGHQYNSQIAMELGGGYSKYLGITKISFEVQHFVYMNFCLTRSRDQSVFRSVLFVISKFFKTFQNQRTSKIFLAKNFIFQTTLWINVIRNRLSKFQIHHFQTENYFIHLFFY